MNTAQRQHRIGAIANRYVCRSCTLDGKPATVAGMYLDYARIATLDGKQSIEYAWPTVQRVMESGGNFRS